MAEGLTRMGIKVRYDPDSAKIMGGTPRGAEVDSWGDHRIAMSLAVLALTAEGETNDQGRGVRLEVLPGILGRPRGDWWEDGEDMSNSIGTEFRVTSVGESHGKCVGVVDRRVPRGARLRRGRAPPYDGEETPRHQRGHDELGARTDAVEMLSGVHEGHTTGAPILMLTWNRDHDSSSYDSIKGKPRPGHADYTAWARYGGFNDHRGRR